MNKLIIAGFLTLITTLSTHAEVIVDVFGVDPQTATEIKKQYASEVKDLESAKAKNIYKATDEELANNEKVKSILNDHHKLSEAIKEQYNFAFVDFQSVQYPLDKDIYTTIEVVKQNDAKRLKYVEKTSTKTFPQKNDIIQKMIEFQEIAVDIAMNEKNPDYVCPVNHCIASFNNPALKPYLEMFNTAVKKDKKLIMNTLKNDPDVSRRGAAVFLIGHIKNPNTVIKILLPEINNESMLVRNNSMRVIGETIERNKLSKINAEPFIKQLDSPYLTDRNKALYVLSGLMEQDKAKKQLLSTGKERLIKVLHLTQPNNHDYAYKILKSISGKDYGDRNYKGWETWAKESSSAKKLSKT